MSTLLQQARLEWQELLQAAESGEARCAPYRALLQGVLQLDLARVFPYMSMWTLRLSLTPEYPWDQTGLPDIDSIPDQPECFRLDEGDALTLAQTLEALVPLLQSARPYQAD